MSHRSRWLWIVVLLTSPIVVLTKPPEYMFIELAGGVGRPFAINERGHIVGRLGSPTFSAVMWDDDGSIIARDTRRPPNSEADGINNRGQVVGTAGGIGNVLWEDGTQFELGGIGLGAIRPAAINERGQIVGSIPTAIAGASHAALWENGTILDLGVLPGDSESVASAINNRSQIIGSSYTGVHWRAFIWDKGTMSELPGLDSQEGDTLAYDINNRGQVVGSSGSRPVVWENGIPIPLDTFLPSTSGVAAGINDSGDIVGSLKSPTTSDILPVLWQNGRPLALPTRPLNPGIINGSFATDINNGGTIIGYRVPGLGAPENVPMVWVRNPRSGD